MNRTDRLYALVEELRAVAPRPRTAKWLADRFEVSVRTIERDLLALQESGVPIWGSTGPGGGYTVDPAHTLPPVNFTATEATAIAVALARPGATPFIAAGRRALQKLVAAMRDTDAEQARQLAARIQLMDDEAPDIPAAIETAILERRVVELVYEDKGGAVTERAIEPSVFLGAGPLWYVSGWCRLRGGPRSFRVDRIRSARLTFELAPERPDFGPPAEIADLIRTPPLE